MRRRVLTREDEVHDRIANQVQLGVERLVLDVIRFVHCVVEEERDEVLRKSCCVDAVRFGGILLCDRLVDNADDERIDHFDAAGKNAFIAGTQASLEMPQLRRCLVAIKRDLGDVCKRVNELVARFTCKAVLQTVQVDAKANFAKHVHRELRDHALEAHGIAS